LISPNFQIFLTCTESRFLSPALRSRCFCVHTILRKDESSICELSEIVLSQSSSSSIYCNTLAPILANIFIAINEESKGKDFLFSKDKFSLHRIVNCAKGIGNDIVSSISISCGLEMSFVFCFREFEFQNYVTDKIHNILLTFLKKSIKVSQNNWIELKLLAGRLEFISLYYAFPPEYWPKKVDERLDKVFSELYPTSERIQSLPKIKSSHLTVSFEDVCSEFEESFHNYFQHITLSELSPMISFLEEICFIILKFHF
jgi:hypothetical protein